MLFILGDMLELGQDELQYHQDIIDFPSRKPDFATFYYYLTHKKYSVVMKKNEPWSKKNEPLFFG